MPMRGDSGQFIRTPSGVKTPRMLEVEAQLGRSLEEDYREYYIKKEWGQTRLANRWGVRKATVFSRSLRGGRRSWSEMLGLPVRRASGQSGTKAATLARPACEICGWAEGKLDGAHFIPRASGGPRGWNILQLCPNCHRRLDSGDREVLLKAKEVLLMREASRLLDETHNPAEARRKLLRLAKQVVGR